VIGINTYGKDIPNLNNAVKDAKAFEELLQEKYGFEKEHTTALYEDQANGDNILDALDALQRKLGPDDNLVFYFSGHGELVEPSQRGYWLPADSLYAKRQSYVNNAEIQDFIKNCRARHVFGVVDACFSGALLRQIKNPYVEKYYTKNSRRLMTSGLIEPVPDGLPDFHSPFAATLLHALKYNPKPYLSTSELWQEMQEALASNTYSTPAYEPIFNVGHQGGEFFFMRSDSMEIPVGVVDRESREQNPSESNLVSQGQERSAPKDLSKMPLEDLKIELKKQASIKLKTVLSDIDKLIDKRGSTYNSFIHQNVFPPSLPLAQDCVLDKAHENDTKYTEALF